MGSSAVAQVVSEKKAVLFDLFHTLTSVETGRDFSPTTYEVLGLSKEAWAEQMRRTWRARMTGEWKDPLCLIRSLAHAVSPAISEDVLAAALQQRLARFARELLELPPETLPVLQALEARGKRLGLIGNADVIEIAAWPRSPMAPHFSETVFSCHVGLVKPEPGIYRLCMRRLEVAPAQCVFVGDGGSDELAGARAVGITSVMMAGVIRQLWPDQVTLRRPQADYMIERLAELIE
jgi:putative hydrolase of the HAD superfamily